MTGRVLSNAARFDFLEEEGADFGLHPVTTYGQGISAEDGIFAAEMHPVLKTFGWGLRAIVEHERIVCSFGDKNTLARIAATRHSRAERGDRTRLRLAHELRMQREQKRKTEDFAEVREDARKAKRQGTEEAFRRLVLRQNVKG